MSGLDFLFRHTVCHLVKNNTRAIIQLHKKDVFVIYSIYSTRSTNRDGP